MSGSIREKSSAENWSSGRGSNNQAGFCISLNDPLNVGRYVIYGTLIQQQINP